MRRSLWILTAIITINAAPAAAGGSAFCIRGCDFGGGSGIGDCSFSTYQQCQATASGRDASCAANPYFNAHAEMQPAPGRSLRRKF